MEKIVIFGCRSVLTFDDGSHVYQLLFGYSRRMRESYFTEVLAYSLVLVFKSCRYLRYSGRLVREISWYR